MKTTSVLQRFDKLQQVGKIVNFQQICGVSGCTPKALALTWSDNCQPRTSPTFANLVTNQTSIHSRVFFGHIIQQYSSSVFLFFWLERKRLVMFRINHCVIRWIQRWFVIVQFQIRITWWQELPMEPSVIGQYRTKQLYTFEGDVFADFSRFIHGKSWG